MKKYFFVAGEVSGDLHGSRLMEALGSKNQIRGVGGPRMRKMGLDCFFPMEHLQVMGFTDVFKSLPRLWKLFQALKKEIIRSNPDCLVLIDYPGFNLRLGKALRKQGYKGKIIQYICPSVWAHGKGRIQTLAENFNLLLSIYPFESAYFTHTSLPVKYIGNPLTDTINAHSYKSEWKIENHIPEDKKLIALFPGSRKGEIERHLPIQLETAALVKKDHPESCFVISCAQEHLKESIIPYIQKSELKLNHDIFIIPSDMRYELMKECVCALAKSGTATLELALHSTPTVVHYDISVLNYFIAKYILRLKLPYYCIVNILYDKLIFPEFIGRKNNPVILKNSLVRFYSNRDQEIQQACENLKMKLGNQPTHQLAAAAIKEISP